MVLRADDRGHTWMDSNGNEVHDALDDVYNALWAHRDLVVGAFDYYSCLMDHGIDKETGEVDIFSLSFNAYTEFTRGGHDAAKRAMRDPRLYRWMIGVAGRNTSTRNFC